MGASRVGRTSASAYPPAPMTPSNSNRYAVLVRSSSGLALAAMLSLTGCDKGEADGADPKAGAAEAGGSAAAAGGASAKEVKTFLEDQRKKGCEMLSPALVAKLYSVPEDALRPIEIGGCTYSYRSADKSQVVEVSIMSITVRKDAADARMYFDNATASRSAEEIRAQLDMVMGEAKKADEIDSEAKAKAVDQVGGAMAGMVPDGGFQYEDVDGVGDAARLLAHEGNLTVLVGNMMFTVDAYAGPAAPKPDMSGAGADTDKIMAIAKQANAEWMAQTRDQRKQQAIELAKAIIAEL